jgi:hypothetical protein
MKRIYAIECIRNGLTYVGFSSDHWVRWRTHRRLLRRRLHACTRMVEDWHKYGPEAFTRRVIEFLPANSELPDAREAELRWQGHFARLGRLYNEPKCSVCGRVYDFGAIPPPERDNPDIEETTLDGALGDPSGEPADSEAGAEEGGRDDR